MSASPKSLFTSAGIRSSTPGSRPTTRKSRSPKSTRNARGLRSKFDVRAALDSVHKVCPSRNRPGLYKGSQQRNGASGLSLGSVGNSVDKWLSISRKRHLALLATRCLGNRQQRRRYASGARPASTHLVSGRSSVRFRQPHHTGLCHGFALGWPPQPPSERASPLA